jgi:hypothetical protein
MTGYGVPSPAAPPPPRSGAALSLFDLIAAGLGLVAFILAFLPWVGIDCSGLPAESRSDCEKVSYTGWDLAAGTTGSVLLLAAALLLVRRLFDSTADRASSVPALLAVLGAVVIVVQLIVGAPLLSTVIEVKDARKIGLFLALIVGLAEAVVAVIGWMQSSGRMARRAPAPAGGAPWERQQQPGPEGGWPGYPQQPPQPQQQGQPGQGYPQQPPPQQQPPAYGQGGPVPGPASGGYPAQPRDYPNPDYPPQQGYPGQEQPRDYPPQSGYPSQGGYPQR